MSLKWRSDDTQGPWTHNFGPGDDGVSYVAPANSGCSGTGASTTLTLDAASTFSNNDLVIIVQMRGTAVGGYMLNKIISGGGTTTLTLETALDITYTDSGASQAQILEMKSYTNLDIGSATVTPSGWDGNKGGIGGFFNNGTLIGNGGTLTLKGGESSSAARVVGGGFRGGSTTTGTGTANRGEGENADQTAATSANGMAGGGASATTGTAGGGGGGHATGGGNGTVDGTATAGTGGGTAGVASLVTIFAGGAGGGGRRDTGAISTAGSNGGGIWFIFSEHINLTDGSGLTIDIRGGDGFASGGGPGAGGAGGSCLLKFATATLGTNKILATGGAGATSTEKPANSGAGGVGRIHADYSSSFTGTTNPTIDTTLDSTIIGLTAATFFMMF